MVGYFKKKRWVSCDSEEYINYINKNIINVNYKTREKIYPDIRLEWKFLFALIRLSIGVNVNNAIKIVDSNKENINYKYLYELAKRHSIVSLIAPLIDKNSCQSEIYDLFQSGYNANVRKTILFDNERNKIIHDFESQNINYCFLKGIIINSFYPKIGLREFGDNDILIRKDDWKKVRDIFKNYGYDMHIARDVHDSYYKKPFFNFEMHRALFDDEYKFSKYFNSIWSRLIQKKDNEYVMTSEDFYCYFLAHFFKHYESGGSGIRSFVDMYLIKEKVCSVKGFNVEYVNKVLKEEKIEEFEKEANNLVKQIFEVDDNYDYLSVLYIIESGTYGILKHDVENSLNKQGGSKFKYVFSRVFLPYRQMAKQYKILKPLPFLLPLFWVIRTFRVVFSSSTRTKFKGEVRALKEYKK